jgi:UDP-N-acetylglucosamine--N-acetylmuramyl-(pentapeptide) pyrophosphoryl-undecaprenol N-acetylglucosamine transferase
MIKEMAKKKTIILSGGGTGGSVAPLLAIAEEIKRKDSQVNFLFVGTRKGKPEKKMVQESHLPFCAIFSGKLRRYFSWQNFIDPFYIILGFVQSFFILLKYRPWAVVSAGGFVAVPLSLAARLVRVPVFIHQQDIVPGLANKILAPLAEKITVSFKKSLSDFPSKKVVFTGNPFRKIILQGDRARAFHRFNLQTGLPVLLIMGGGTGAKNINEFIFKIIPCLVKFCQVIHLTGKNKGQAIVQEDLTINRYHQIEFLTREMPDVYKVADLVITRAGLGALTELSVLAKPSLVVPIVDSHQEINAQYFKEKEAIVLVREKELIADKFLNQVENLIKNQEELNRLSRQIHQLAQLRAGEKIADLILKTKKK